MSENMYLVIYVAEWFARTRANAYGRVHAQKAILPTGSL